MEMQPRKLISGKVPYYLFCLFFFLLVVVSIASLVKTHRLLQQAQNDLVIWSEAHQEKWATKDHVPLITMQKKQKLHTSYAARARAAQRAIHSQVQYKLLSKVGGFADDGLHHFSTATKYSCSYFDPHPNS